MRRRLGRLRIMSGLAVTFGLLLASALTVGCKTLGDDGGGKPLLDGTDLAPPAQMPQDDLAKVPVSMWSPAQRQATATYYYLVAETMAMKEREPKKSLPVFEAAYGLDPNPFLGSKMLSTKAAAGERAEAMLEARKMVLLYPRDPYLRFLYGDMLTKEGQLDGAVEQLEKCVELNPAYEPAYLELTEVYLIQKQPAKAVVVTKELTKNVPSSISGWTLLARILLQQNQAKEALTPARRAYEMQSANPHIAQVYAVVLQLNGKTKQALRIYEQLYRLDPTDDELTARMVELYREIGNLENALDLLNEMAKQGGRGRPAIEMQKALVLWELKRNKEASELLTKLAQDYPDSDRLKYLAAAGYERLESWEQAIEAYKAVPDTSPFRFHADFRTVVILKQLKRYDEAATMAKQMLASNQADWDAWGIAAGVFADAERYDDAVSMVDEGYKKFPERHRLLFLKGVYQEKAGDREACVETMRQVIVVDPTNSSALNYLGYLFAEKGENLDEAEKLITRALELKPDDGFYLDSLGWVEYQRGNYDKALPLLERASKSEPKEGVIIEHIGDVKLKKGDKAGARDDFERALKATLEDKDKLRIEGKLKELDGK